MGLFLGIDGGGSKTSCWIGDESSVLGRGIAAGSNVVRGGAEQARDALGISIRHACAAAKVAPSQIQATCAGVAGGARPETGGVIRQILAELVAGEIEVVGDMVIALQGAFGRGPGVVVIAGTGSIAYGRSLTGETARAGGWGFSISDEGSGHWIGRSAIASALRALDEGHPAALLAGVLKSWNLMSLEELIVRANASPPPDFAGLLPAVLSAADAGDPIAGSVLTQAGAELATLAKIVIRRLFPQVEAVPVAMSGGVFGNCALVRQVFYNSLRSEYPQVPVTASVVDPAAGALELARESGRRSS